MALIVVSFGLNGIGWRKGFLRGGDERYPLTTVRFLFFRAILLGREAAVLHMNTMFGLADDTDWLLANFHPIKRYIASESKRARASAEEGVNRQLQFYKEAWEAAEAKSSKAESENCALRKVIKICSE